MPQNRNLIEIGHGVLALEILIEIQKRQKKPVAAVLIGAWVAGAELALRI